MAYIPHPDEPGEVEEIEKAMRELHKCQVMGRYDQMALAKWLETYPDEIWKELESLRHLMKEMYPPLAPSVNDHGNIQPHHHQAS